MIIQKDRDRFFQAMYMMFQNTARYKIKTGQREWLYDKGVEELFVRTGVEVPPMSKFIISSSSDENNRNRQSVGGSSSRSQNSVLSILADTNNREKLDKDMSATISNKIDDHFILVDDYLHSNVSNSDASPIPEFRIQKKRAYANKINSP